MSRRALTLLSLFVSLAFHALIFFSFVSRPKEQVQVAYTHSSSAFVVTVKQVIKKQRLEDAKEKVMPTHAHHGQAGVKEESLPQLIGELAPKYPWRARMQGEEGEVIVDLMVDAQGLPHHIKIKTSSGHDLLDQAALQAVQAARFQSAQSELVALQLSLNFKLREKR